MNIAWNFGKSKINKLKKKVKRLNQYENYIYKSFFLAANVKLRPELFIDWIWFDIFEKVKSINQKWNKGKNKKINKKTTYIIKNI